MGNLIQVNGIGGGMDYNQPLSGMSMQDKMNQNTRRPSTKTNNNLIGVGGGGPITGSSQSSQKDNKTGGVGNTKT